MGKGINLLIARSVTTVAEPGRYADGGGLYLQVRARSDAVERLWVFIFKRGGRGEAKRKLLSIGPARDISLADARAVAAECRALLAAGKDPREAIQKKKGIPTFGECADELLDDILPGFRNDKHQAQWRMTLGDAYCRKLRTVPINEVGTQDVLGVLKTIWLSKPETASRIRGRIERVLDVATIGGHRPEDSANPARWKGHLQLLLPTQDELSRGHHRALPWADLPAFMQELRKLTSISALALEWTILTAARTQETTGASLKEIAEATAVWTLPAERMKMKREHRVPLVPRCMEILAEMKKLGQEWIFPGQSLDGTLSNQAMSECLKGLDVDATVHGFRSTFRDWVLEATNYPEELAEIALSHKLGTKTEQAYKRGDALVKRRQMMLAWEQFCLKGGAEVVQLSAVG